MLKPIQNRLTQTSKWLWLVLGLSFLLNLDAFWWGLPSQKGWAADEILPYMVWQGMLEKFSGGWTHFIYPPFHFYLVSIFYAPVYVLEKLVPVIDFYDIRVYTAVFLATRFVSVLMGTGVVFLTYACARELLSRRAALLAALTTALSCTVIYYSKFVNVDIPYVFWFGVALWCYFKLLKTHRLRYYIGYAAAAVTSVCTKDQAYGLYLLTTLFIVGELYWTQRRKFRGESLGRAIARLASDRRIYLPILTGVALFAIYHNLLLNWTGFISRIQDMTSSASYNTPEYEQYFANTFANHVDLFVRVVADFLFSLGVPLGLLCLAGVVTAFRHPARQRILLCSLVPILSYYVTFLCAILYSRDRFLLPVVVVFALFGGKLMDDLLRAVRPLKWAIAAIFLYTLCYSLSVNLLMHQDARYAAEAWMRDNIDRQAPVMMYGWEHFLPRRRVLDLGAVQVKDTPDLAELQDADPDYIVRTSLMGAQTFPETMLEHQAYEQLDEQALGYEMVYQTPQTFRWNLLPLGSFYLHENPRRRSGNFDKIDPDITVWRQKAASANPARD